MVDGRISDDTTAPSEKREPKGDEQGAMPHDEAVAAQVDESPSEEMRPENAYNLAE